MNPNPDTVSPASLCISHCSEGSAILQHPDRQVLVGDNVSLTCRLRGNPVPTEVVLYRGDVEVRRQSGGSLRLGTVGLSEQGSYRCEARLGDNMVKSPPIRITVLGKRWTSLSCCRRL